MTGTAEDLERRLLNWARWKTAGGGLSRNPLGSASSGGGVFAGGSGAGSGYRETVMPILAGEALETDAAVNRLEPKRRDALRAWYLGLLPDGKRVPALRTQGRLAELLGYALRSFERILEEARAEVAACLLARRSSREPA